MEMDHYNDHITSQFIKVGNGSYLAKDDPKFLEKYLKYFPNDAKCLYEYGQKLEEQGKMNEAINCYRRAIKNGYLAADSRIQALQETPKIETKPKKRERNRSYFLMLLGFLNVIVFTTFIILFINLFQGNTFLPFKEANESFPLKTVATNETGELLTSSCETCGGLLDDNEVPLMITVLQNGLERYKAANGTYPKTLSMLVGKPPNNWLSFLPADITYEASISSYTMEWQNYTFRNEDKSNLLELHHYPKTKELAVMKGEDVLAVYDVAIGREPLPFRQSVVQRRVVNPNNGDGPLGTRGLTLGQNYAIHGTDKPDSIGNEVTLGCLRLLNSDIETLYPYISLGTPLFIKEGTLDQLPFYQNGLPNLVENEMIIWNRESQPLTTFTWKD